MNSVSLPSPERVTHKSFDMRMLKRDVAWKLEMAAQQQQLAKAVSARRIERAECPICVGCDSARFALIHDYPYNECATCGHIYSQRPPAQEGISALYQDGAQPGTKSVQNQVYMQRELFEVRVRNVASPKVAFATARTPGGGRWVDIGAGVGDLVKAARDLGWDVVGIECDQAQVEFAAQVGVDLQSVYVTPDNAGELLTGATVVSLINFLEHQLDPGSFVRMIGETLPAGAHLLFEVPRHPSLSSLANQAFPALAARHIYPPDHLHIFTENSMTRMVEAAGLRVRSLWTFGQDAFELLSSAFAQTGKSQPGFYDAIIGLSADMQRIVDEHHLSDTMLVLAQKPT